MASCRVDQNRALTEHFKQRAVIKFCANSELMPTETWNFFSEHNSEKRVLDRTLFSGTSDFGKVERTSATISRMATELSTFKSQPRGIRLQKRDE